MTIILVSFACLFLILCSMIYFILCFSRYLKDLKRKSKIDILVYSILILACLSKLSLTSVSLAAAIMQDYNIVDYITTHGNFISTMFTLPRMVSNMMILTASELNAYKLINTILSLKMYKFN